MVAKLTVVFFIILCVLLGLSLIILPWMSFGIVGDWGDNYLLAFVAEKANLPLLKTTVASGWVRGAVTGLGVLNLIIAAWETTHFDQSVRLLEGNSGEREPRVEEQTSAADVQE